MPVSKKRKKKGKKVGNGMKYRRENLERFENMESGVSLEDLLRVVAYQEAHPDKPILIQGLDEHTKMPNDGRPQIGYSEQATVHDDGTVSLPVVVYTGSEKKVVGEAKFDAEGNMLSSTITDPDAVPGLEGGTHHYSISEEN